VAVGARAPYFESVDQHGAPVTLQTLLTGGGFVLMFYPLTFSPICTRELDDLRTLAGARAVSVSCDSMFVQRAFADAHHIDYPMLTDFWPHGAISTAYDAFDAGRGISLRASFAIGADGLIRDLIRQAAGEQRALAAHLRLAASLT
jgi:peroxiredoxin